MSSFGQTTNNLDLGGVSSGSLENNTGVEFFFPFAAAICTLIGKSRFPILDPSDCSIALAADEAFLNFT